MEEAHQLCDRLVVMDKGKVLDVGTPLDLVRRHLPRYVLETTEAIATPPQGVTLEVHGDITFLYADDPKPLEALARKSGDDFRIRMSGLEDVFLKLTGRDLHESE
jgi:ABC-type multidrug transport system ATPase subunit